MNDKLKQAEELLDQMLSRAYYGSDEHEELLSLISQLVEENQKQKEVINKAVIWFNSVEEGFASDLRPDVARADFYRSLRANRLLTN